MTRRYGTKPTPDASVTEAALDALDAEELRTLVREIIPWLDASTHARLVNALVDRAARNPSSWVPDGPTAGEVDEITTFAAAAQRQHQADPSQVDDYLRLGSNAFLAKDYPAAFQIFHALLRPLSDAAIDLGQHEMLDEVLGVELTTCAAQYVVSMYMTATPKHRAKAVLTAIDEVHGVGYFWEPLRELERIVVEPLPEFDAFLADWRVLIEERAKERLREYASDEDRWLREAVLRTEGTDGLAELARNSKRSDDLRAWCRALVEAKDWKRALEAYEEAAELVADNEYTCGDFLDGAALATQELGHKDLPARLERAWRRAPSMARLRSWLGSTTDRDVLRDRVSLALETCPKHAARQRALLHVLLNDFGAAAKLLGSAPGLGWSNEEHPGHLLFPLFTALLTRTAFDFADASDFDELSALTDRSEPRLTRPETATLVELAEVTRPEDGRVRTAMLVAMRTAAERRIEDVTENKRRRHYEHAAALALTCVRIDPEGSAPWLAKIRNEYSRYPALQRAFEMGSRC